LKILITGIGCVGKSTLRERLTASFPKNVISVDMDYNKTIPSDANKVILVESVHGLEDNPHRFDKILYLLPPKGHIIFWIKRAWIWFMTGIVDLSEPKGKKKRFASSNIPIILKIIIRNIMLRQKWIELDINKIQKKFIGRTEITSSIEEGYLIIKSWIPNDINGDISRRVAVNV
jgi:hypothetical protein